ncbi:MAG: hypothetical protein AB1516_00690 [Pseudomonadota bacterium]
MFHSSPNYKPLSPEEEAYFHIVMCLRDLEQCSALLEQLDGEEKLSEVQKAAYKLAIITYAKPFTSAFGVAKNKYKLGLDIVAKEHLGIHRHLMSLRDQVLAHSDLSPRQAKVFMNSATPDVAAIVSLSGDPRLPQMHSVKSVVAQVAESLKQRRLQLSNELLEIQEL